MTIVTRIDIKEICEELMENESKLTQPEIQNIMDITICEWDEKLEIYEVVGIKQHLFDEMEENKLYFSFFVSGYSFKENGEVYFYEPNYLDISEGDLMIHQMYLKIGSYKQVFEYLSL